VRYGVSQDFGIGRGLGQHFAQQHDGMPELPEYVAQVVRHIVIEQESHGLCGASCCATSRSISPR
jgi:hypothetical protein